MPSHAVGLQTAEFSLNERREATVLPPSLWPKRVATKPGCRQFLDRIEGRDARESLAGDRSGAALGDVEESTS